MRRIILIIFFLFFLFHQPVVASWSQDAGNAQRTGYTPEEPVEPWTYTWSFNGPDSNGTAAGHSYDGPREGRTIVGNGMLFVPGGAKGLFGLNLTTGQQLWNITGTSFMAAPAYDAVTNSVFAGGSDGKLYKINAATGTIQTYTAGSPLSKAVLLVGNYVYVVTDSGQLHKVTTSTMVPVWVYTAGSTIATPPSYSLSRDVIIFATDDLYVHAVNNTDGSRKWRVKPTPNAPGDPTVTVTSTLGGTPVGTQFENAWPVIAEQHGIVLLRMQLPPSFMIDYPSVGSIYPSSNAATRSYLQSNPNHKNLFALNLDDGSEKFIPAVGYGSTEDEISTRTEGYGVMGSQPVVKVTSDGKEVVYIHFRNGQSNPPDGRWDGHMGEMVLDDTTIPGLVAGDLRFVRMSSYNGYGGTSYVFIIDEQNPLTVAGNTIFQAHWGASESVMITDRSATLGLSYSSPIATSKHPSIIRAIQSCGTANFSTHYSTCGMSYMTDGGRYWPSPGFWIYWNVVDPPGWKIGSGNTAFTQYSAGFLPRYTYVSDGYMIVEGNGGDISIFKHSGTVLFPTVTPSGVQPTVPLTPSPTISLGNGDANNDGTINVLDLTSILQKWLALLTTSLDQYGDGRINALDFVRVIKQLPPISAPQ